MVEIITAVLDKSPPWLHIISSLILIVILLIITYFVFIAAKRYADNVNKENKIISLQSENSKLEKKNSELESINEQFLVVLSNAKNLMQLLHSHGIDTGLIDEQLTEKTIQRVVETLAADIKYTIGEKHRVGFWMDLEDSLFLAHASAGFPLDYVFQRKLDIHHSIAGRCHRKQEVLKIDDVKMDPDWRNSDSESSYSALICIPIKDWGVITIDAKEKMSNNTLQVGLLYCSILANILDHIRLSNRLASSVDAQENFDPILQP
ncbi:GAF domain-containing protein [Bacillus altitudinis]|uniref:GAF domain-containing protein n=1 Tax=Bacillus altitudinis TaxID=293387 RepID=UPI0035D89850